MFRLLSKMGSRMLIRLKPAKSNVHVYVKTPNSALPQPNARPASAIPVPRWHFSERAAPGISPGLIKLCRGLTAYLFLRSNANVLISETRNFARFS